MNKKLVGFFTIFIALFVGAFYFTNVIQSPLISTLNYFKINYHELTTILQNSFQRYTFQATKIDSLKEELQKYENNHLVMQQMASEISDLYKIKNSKLKLTPQVELVRTISYQKFGDLNKIWIDIKDYNSSKVYGLIYNELVAGIVVSQDDKALGLLNKDFKSSYAVYVGKEKAPGIVHGNNEENLLVKFIPTWFSIKAGDIVTTSGLDNIFFKGLKVGKVLSISRSQGYQNAIIEPYYQANDPNYFHLIRRVK
ncbi:MAG: rod shape-determining protein MreC [Campylobacterota bacterium]|nr:rod shape-determining protein MreC [Campylobacterota bacterium]